MKKCASLKLFCREVMRLVGCGYIYVQFIKLDEKDPEKIAKYLHDIEQKHEIDKTRGAKAWNRYKDRCNIDAVFFEVSIVLVIAKTKGSLHENLIKKGVKDYMFEKVENVIFRLSEHISLKMYKEKTSKEDKAKAKEKGKAPKVERWTFKLESETFQRTKAEYFHAIEKNNRKHFETLQTKWKGLPHYVGIGVQRTNLNHFVKENLKKYSRKWSVTF